MKAFQTVITGLCVCLSAGVQSTQAAYAVFITSPHQGDVYSSSATMTATGTSSWDPVGDFTPSTVIVRVYEPDSTDIAAEAGTTWYQSTGNWQVLPGLSAPIGPPSPPAENFTVTAFLVGNGSSFLAQKSVTCKVNVQPGGS